MELRMTVHLPRRQPRAVEVVVRWAGRPDVAALRDALARALGEPVVALAVEGRPIGDQAVVGMPPLLDGVSVAVLPTPGAPPVHDEGTTGVLRLAVVGGPDAGRCRPLLPPGLEVGRAPAVGLRVEDPSLSRRHVRVVVDADGVRVQDLGSTNGVLVDGVRVEGTAAVDTRSTVVIGGTMLRLRRAAGAGLPVRHPGDGTIVLDPVPAGAPPGAPRQVRAPDPPPEPHRAKIPWLAALVPLPVALVLAAVLGPHLLAFALLGPVLLLGNALGDRWSGGRQRRRSHAEHTAALAAARATLAAALGEEARRRHLEHPDPHAVLERVEHRLPGLWAAPAGSATVRLGLGDVPASTGWVTATGTEQVTAHDVPVVVDLGEVRVLGVVGSPEQVRRAVDWVLGQLCAALPPDRLRLVVADDDPAVAGWRLVPHAAPGGPAADAVTVTVARCAPGVPAPAAPHGGALVATAPHRAHLPAGGAVLEPGPDGRHRLTAPDGSVTPLRADGVGPWWTEGVQRALAPVRLARAGATRGLPVRLDLADVVGADRLTADGMGRHWDRHGADGPTAVVGRRPGGVLRLDLRRDGPHVLVGGTTGSGKSEFLRTLVTGLALESPPERLALLLVDFKGGAAFGPCAALPHVVGLLTDLDDHLVERALASLRAELRRREHVLAEAGVADIDDLPSGPVRDALPRLVVAVDELRTLVDQLPELARGLVRLAAQGRSLGIHLVLATQRPGGAVTGEVRANVDLRIAFRVRDRADSLDVVDDPGAADLDPEVPGRALARGGDGSLTAFQTALVSPAPVAGAEAVDVEVLRPGSGPGVEVLPRDRTREVEAVVEVIRRAAAGRTAPRPRPPWLPALPPVVRREDPDAGSGALAVLDEPEHQRRRPLRVDQQVPLWRFVGRPRTGRTGALCALVAAAVETHSPHDLHVHVVDAGGTLSAAVAGLPHLGTSCRAHDAEAVAALLAHLTGEVGRRRESGAGPASRPGLLLVVDGWEALVEADDPRSAEPASDLLLRLLRDGAGVGLVGAVAGGRGLLHTRWQGLGGRMVLLGPLDPLDAAAAGTRPGALPLEPPAGRGVLAGEGRELQVVRVEPEDLTRTGVRWPAAAATAPWRYRPLPRSVRHRDLSTPSPDDALLLGVAGPTASPWAWTPRATAGRLLVAGPPRSGRTNALQVLAASATRAGWPVVLVAPEDEPDVLAGLLRRHPDLLVLADDADRLEDAALASALHEAARRADRGSGGIVLATTAAALATRFRGLDVETARRGHAVLLRPSPGDGDVLGIRLPRAGPEDGVPGRGVVVADGRATRLQVLLSG